MDGFARRKAQSKDDIRKAAAELFGQFGMDKVSIACIARTAGVSQATIYNNFGSKDGVVREFVTGAVEGLVNRVQEVLAPEKPSETRWRLSFSFSRRLRQASGPRWRQIPSLEAAGTCRMTLRSSAFAA